MTQQKYVQSAAEEAFVSALLVESKEREQIQQNLLNMNKPCSVEDSAATADTTASGLTNATTINSIDSTQSTIVTGSLMGGMDTSRSIGQSKSASKSASAIAKSILAQSEDAKCSVPKISEEELLLLGSALASMEGPEAAARQLSPINEGDEGERKSENGSDTGINVYVRPAAVQEALDACSEEQLQRSAKTHGFEDLESAVLFHKKKKETTKVVPLTFAAVKSLDISNASKPKTSLIGGTAMHNSGENAKNTAANGTPITTDDDSDSDSDDSDSDNSSESSTSSSSSSNASEVKVNQDQEHALSTPTSPNGASTTSGNNSLETADEILDALVADPIDLAGSPTLGAQVSPAGSPVLASVIEATNESGRSQKSAIVNVEELDLQAGSRLGNKVLADRENAKNAEISSSSEEEPEQSLEEVMNLAAAALLKNKSAEVSTTTNTNTNSSSNKNSSNKRSDETDATWATSQTINDAARPPVRTGNPTEDGEAEVIFCEEVDVIGSTA